MTRDEQIQESTDVIAQEIERLLQFTAHGTYNASDETDVALANALNALMRAADLLPIVE